MKDKEVKNLINLEESSHKNSLNLIASENYPSKDVYICLWFNFQYEIC